MSLETRIVALAQAVGTDVKSLTIAQGNLSALTTTAKTNLVAAINELVTAIAIAGVEINDTAEAGNTVNTWSANKIYASIEAAKTAVANGLFNDASTALATLQELAATMGNDPNFATTVAMNIANRVRFDAVQPLPAQQQAQACANIGIGDPERDLAAAYATARA